MTVNTNGPAVVEVLETDEKGRPLAQYMNDREVMEAILHNQRAMLDLVNDFVENMKNNPMMKMMSRKS